MGSLVIYRKSCESSEEAGSDFDRLYDFVHEFTGREPELREHGFVDIWLGFRVFSPKSFRGVLPILGFPFRDVNGCLVGRREDCTAGDCYDVVFSLWDMSREGRKEGNVPDFERRFFGELGNDWSRKIYESDKFYYSDRKLREFRRVFRRKSVHDYKTKG